MSQRLIPYGNANFEEIASKNYYFVDKTKYIAELEKYKCPVFLRPRRFGKSVFTEMLRWYYDIKAKDRFDELFGKFYIGKNPTPDHNSYLFMSFDFSGMGTWCDGDKNFVKKQFDANVLTKLDYFLRYYRDILEIDNRFISDFNKSFYDNATDGLKKVLSLASSKSIKTFVVIDEYDSLTNALAVYYRYASEEENEYLNVLKKGGFFRSFFEALKEGLKLTLEKVYITGILPITIADMNSEFNVAQWITFKPELVNMLG
ncbi:MAG: AAA family ATPase, partial [Bacteroidetes bacterium]|nr:AAA family ATPase [Bacteroidota bacterium]